MAVLAASCATGQEIALIGKQQPKIENGHDSPKCYGRSAGWPDTGFARWLWKILYSVSYYSVPQNKSNSELFANEHRLRLPIRPKSAKLPCAKQAKWMKDKRTHRFPVVRNRNYATLDHESRWCDRTQITDREGGGDFAFSADESKLLLLPT